MNYFNMLTDEEQERLARTPCQELSLAGRTRADQRTPVTAEQAAILARTLAEVNS